MALPPVANLPEAPARLDWTHHPEHNLTESLLALHPGDRVIDLGCGTGEHAAYLATRLEIRAVGINLSSRQMAAARERWADVPNLELVEEEALSYLSRESDDFDAAYSIFGAIWFAEPAYLLPAIANRLRPGGRLAFSHWVPGGREFSVPRWDLPPQTWCDLLAGAGFHEIETTVVDCPDVCPDRQASTMIVSATR